MKDLKKQQPPRRMAEIWTVKKIMTWTIEYFEARGIPEPRLSTELLLSDVLHCNRIDLYLQFDRILSRQERKQFREYVQRRLKREPVQYILGETEFMGLPFRVTPATLIPRPETEILVEAVFEQLQELNRPDVKILDIGTGSGCIAISIAKQYPECEVWAIEKSAEALSVARENAAMNQVSVNFILGDFFQLPEEIIQPFDIVVSNPPYVSEAELKNLQPEIIKYEPRMAVVAGEDGLIFYKKLIDCLPRILKKPGTIFLETGYNQAKAVTRLFLRRGYKTKIKQDYNQIERVVIINYE